MKTSIYKTLLLLSLPLWGLTACNDDLVKGNELLVNSGKRIELSGEIEQVAVTRVNDNGFCDGDKIGVYIVDYQNNRPAPLLSNGNRGNNVKHTYDEAKNKWNSAYDIYWKDSNTHIDVYGYYPFGSPEDVNRYPLTVQKDQSKEAENGEMSPYEASDFLWGKASNVAPTEKVIKLAMHHRMSCVKIDLVEGNGFSDATWAKLEKNVTIQNTKHNAFADLSTGEVTATGEVASTGILPYKKNDYFRAIVVPQTISAGTVLFKLTVDGKPYTFKKEEGFAYTSGKMHNFSIKVDYKENTGDYKFSLVGESITAWENDDVTHDATMKEYIVIMSEAGKLKEAIAAAGKDYTKVENLKVTGTINPSDFLFMNMEMTNLKAVNLKEIKIKGGSLSYVYEDGALTIEGEDNEIPSSAFSYNKRINTIVLPDNITKIGQWAFSQCSSLSGSLQIPEGVITLMDAAFAGCYNLQGTLTLPSTLKIIQGSAFSGCGFTCELKLPEKLELLGFAAFNECSNLYGELHLPQKIKRLYALTFTNCSNLNGDLTIPDNVTKIEERCFAGTGFNGKLTLSNNITEIGDAAFEKVPLRGELVLPSKLSTISRYAFSNCDFTAIILHDNLLSIGEGAFTNNWRLAGVLEFPQNFLSIGKNAFAYCRNIEGLILPESLETINNDAFLECFGIDNIICQSTIPPYVQSGVFDGVSKDNFTLEVPESAIAQYQTAVGWCDFKRIAAHRELVCRPSIANAINTKCTRRLVLNAESDWIVESKPGWCSLSQESGSKKTELTLTINEMPKGSAPREGEIVFKLKDKDYRHKCKVNQYDYQYAEDEIITLQKATKGNRGGINLVFLGDGFDGKDISEGKYMKAVNEQVENFFGIEPYKTYRDYFNVYTAIAVSPETGIGTINTIRYAKFETTFTGGVGLKCDYQAAFNYALRMPTVTKDNLNESLIIIIPNSTDYGGICQMWDDGSAIAFCPMSTYGYPLDTRGVIQHEAGGHGFGKLGDEYIYHNAFIDFCDCACCGHVDAVNYAKYLGWYDNLSLSGKMNEVPWSHFIFDDRYSDIVDIFEGAYMHSRGVFRSEHNSCMNNDIPYYSTISRESIVKRIKRYAGEPYDFEEFVKNDKRDAGATTRFSNTPYTGANMRSYQMPPQIHKGSPLGN